MHDQTHVQRRRENPHATASAHFATVTIDKCRKRNTYKTKIELIRERKHTPSKESSGISLLSRRRTTTKEHADTTTTTTTTEETSPNFRYRRLGDDMARWSFDRTLQFGCILFRCSDWIKNHIPLTGWTHDANTTMLTSWRRSKCM